MFLYVYKSLCQTDIPIIEREKNQADLLILKYTLKKKIAIFLVKYFQFSATDLGQCLMRHGLHNNVSNKF